MRTFYLLLLCLFVINKGYGQTEYQAAEKAVMDYIDGTANGNIDQIEGAFHPDAELYTVSENELKTIPIEKYLTYFKPGRATGRKGRIVALDVVNNAANAIVEIDMRDRRYTDYILLLKVGNEWKIIKKSYTFEPYALKGKVLFVVSGEDRYPGSNWRTGAHFGEIVTPYHLFVQAGYEVDFVSPDGGMVPVSYIQLQDSLQKNYFYDLKFNKKLRHTQKPAEVKPEAYAAIYYAGGAAAMFDLPDNKEIIELARTIYEDQEGIVGAVCHGPAGLVNIRLKDGTYLVDGKKINSFTDEEEGNSGRTKLLPFYLESKLRERGGIFEESDAWQPHVAKDGRLVTGQNPASSELLTNEMIRLMEKEASVSNREK